MDSDNIAVLDSEVVANNTVHSSTTIIQVVVGQDNQNRILSLLALNEDCVTSEEL